MNPAYWLLIVIVCAVALSTVVALIFYGIGWDRCDEHHARVDEERHRHREQDRMPGVLLELPKAGRLVLVEDEAQTLARPGELAEAMLAGRSEWWFAGESEQGWAAESAEYELLTQTTELPATGDETDSGFTRRMAAEVDAMIAAWDAQGNYDRHTMHADG